MIRKGYVDSPEGQIHYRTAGEGVPLVLLHMNPNSSAMWEPVLPLFAERGFRTVAFDTPGYGLSDRPDQEPDMAFYASRIAEAARALDLEPYHLLGHHTGATIAGVLAATYPERIRRLVLWGYPMMNEERMATLAVSSGPTYSPDGSEIAERWRQRWRADDPGYTSERQIRSIIAALQSGSGEQWAIHALTRTDHAALARSLTMPVLLMCGEVDTLWQESLDAVPLVKDARWIPIHGASVDVADEYPEQFVAAVTGFLAEGKRGKGEEGKRVGE